jgi:histone H3/H4
LREIEEGPNGLTWRILEMRAYRQALETYKRAERDEDVEIDENPLTELVREIAQEVEGEIAAEVLGKR